MSSLTYSQAHLRRRKLTNATMTALVWLCFALAMLPLVGVVGYTIKHGLKRFDMEFFTHSMNGVGPLDHNGGAYHALIGTVEQVGIAIILTVPVGILAAIYLVEYGRGWLASSIRFFVDVMTGIPSIVAGLFVLAFWVLGLHQGYSGFAAALALSVLMLPTVVRSSEEMLRLVPLALREGAYALGVPRWKTILRVVLPTALPGVVTGVMLGVARIMGETAPVLLTAFGADFIVNDPFSGPQQSLSLYVFSQARKTGGGYVDRAWTAALTLVLFVLLLNILARLVTRRNRRTR
ncbi:MAG: phosphate ABC transporter permease PstA [Mycobacteriales bacterium]